MSGQIPVPVKVAYGAADGSASLLNTVFAVYFLIFLTDIVGIDPAIAGIVLSSSVIWGAVTDPLIGVISDRTKSRYGRRRPYIIAAAVPTCIFFWLMFSVPPLQGSALVAYYIAMAMLMHIAYTVLFIPYIAMLPEMTQDYDERTNVVSYRLVWVCLGAIAAGSLPLLIVERFGDARVGWSAAGAILGFVSLLAILYTWRATRGWERFSVDTEPLDFREMYRAMLGNRPFRYAIAIFLFGITAAYAFGGIAMYFLAQWMEFSQRQISLYWLVYFGSCGVWVPVIAFVSARIGKQAAYILFMSTWVLVCAVGHMLVQPGQVAVMYVLAFLNSLGFTAAFQLPAAMLPDVVEVDEFKTGRRREGLFLGMAALATKVSVSVSLLLVGQALGLIGYEAGTSNPPSVILGIRIMYGPLIALITVPSIAFAIFFPITRRRHAALLKAIEAKRNGEAWDEESIRGLL
jgi:GPH family glycoside/pentoside/hexuronide:cation symporter